MRDTNSKERSEAVSAGTNGKLAMWARSSAAIEALAAGADTRTRIPLGRDTESSTSSSCLLGEWLMQIGPKDLSSGDNRWCPHGRASRAKGQGKPHGNPPNWPTAAKVIQRNQLREVQLQQFMAPLSALDDYPRVLTLAALELLDDPFLHEHLSYTCMTCGKLFFQPVKLFQHLYMNHAGYLHGPQHHHDLDGFCRTAMLFLQAPHTCTHSSRRVSSSLQRSCEPTACPEPWRR